MARLRQSESVNSDSNLYRQASFTPTRWPSERPGSASAAPHSPTSPSSTSGSDKENRSERRHQGKMGSSRTGGLRDQAGPSAKRRRTQSPIRTAERDESDHSEPEETENQPNDPNQSLASRQRLRKSMRELNNEAVNNRSEWLKADSDQLKEAIKRADNLMHDVKQTSDALIDSRFLVTAGDMAYKRTTAMVTGAGAEALDVDEFVGKCISFMRRAEGSSRRSQHQSQAHYDEDEDGDSGFDAGDGLNWAHFGRAACFPSNSRPPVPGFLLGPLSVQKRARKASQRRANTQRQDLEETRPDELQAADLHKSEQSDLTRMCQRIHGQLRKSISRGTRALERAEAAADGALDDQTVARIAAQHGLDDTGGLSLFKFALNPKSFGQSVENLFYLSFLIRDGFVGIDFDSNGLPSILNAKGDEEAAEEANLSEAERARRERNKTRHQAVLSLDYDTWQGLVDALDIQESLVPDRSAEEGVGVTVGRNGWY